MDPFVFSHPRLTFSNYTSWSLRAKAFLKCHGVWSVLDWETEPPRSPNVVGVTQIKDWIEWKRRDERAQGIIISLVEDSQLLFTAGVKNARELWEQLARTHNSDVTPHEDVDMSQEDRSSLNTAAMLQRSAILKKRYRDGESMQDHISSYVRGNRLLSQLAPHHTFKDEFLAELLLLSLPQTSKWQKIVASLVGAATDTSPITFDTLSSILLLQESTKTSTP